MHEFIDRLQEIYAERGIEYNGNVLSIYPCDCGADRKEVESLQQEIYELSEACYDLDETGP